ncbi:tyrosine-type recombinase/integrase [uncultured Arcticibacterium sp.]|uniref:tyrosine-type recombinase/integrase n=1 Tax=uncultured Arcticibacterium sp. TaxID=2173042 RepID=UPI0030FA1010
MSSAKGTFVSISAFSEMVDSFLSYLQNEKRLSPNTVLAYQKDLAQFYQFIQEDFETDKPSEATFREIRAWIVSLSNQKLANTSINRKIATLKSFYSFLLRKNKINKNPTLKIQSLKTPSKPPVFVSETGMTQLLEELSFTDDFAGNRDQMIIELLYGTGLRLTELINIKLTDLDLFDAKLSVLGKRSKYRIIPISGKLRLNLSTYLGKRTNEFEQSSEYLFLTNKGQKLYPVFVQRLVKKYLTMVSTQTKRSPHVLRHTFATHLLNKGADLNAIKELLGHSSLSATQIYTHNSIEKLKDIHKLAHPKAG